MLEATQVDELMALKPGLAKQTYEQIPEIKLDSHFVMSRQATLNLGTIGHVSHGKTTVVKAISGVDTIKFNKEKLRSSTIKLGYANAKIYKCPNCPSPICYKSYGSLKDDVVECPNLLNEQGQPDESGAPCTQALELVRHVSFVDCPGHDVLMATMLTGAAVMDAALLLVAGDKECPQPQTAEHLSAVEIMQLEHIIILQNKIDLVYSQTGAAKKNYEQIKQFIQGTKAEKSPIIPISAQFGYNIDVLLEYICSFIPRPVRDYSSSPSFMVIRSFDINQPGCKIDDLKGGVVGGSVLRGVLKVGDVIEMRPGNVQKDPNTGAINCMPIQSRVVTLNAEKTELLYAIPGGLIGVGLKIDPSLSRSDMLVGQVLGYPEQLPSIYKQLEIKFTLMQRLAGVKSQTKEGTKVRTIEKGEMLLINVGSYSIGCKIMEIKQKSFLIKVALNQPVCTSIGEMIALSRSINRKMRLIGWGKITKGKE